MTEICEAVKQKQGSVSGSLRVLLDADLVVKTVIGRYRVYQLNLPVLMDMSAELTGLVNNTVPTVSLCAEEVHSND